MKFKKWNVKYESINYLKCYSNIKPPIGSQVTFIREESLSICILRYWKLFLSYIRFVLLQSFCIVIGMFAIAGWMNLEASINIYNYSLYELLDFICLLYIGWCIFSVGINIVKDMWNDTDSFLNDRQLKLIITIWIFEITKLFVKNKKLTVTNIFKCGHYCFFAGIICCLILLIIFIIKFIVQYNYDDIKPIE